MTKLTTILVIFIAGFTFAQQYSTDLVSFPKTHLNGWVTYISNENFEIEYQFIECDPAVGYDHEAIILRVTNKTVNTLDLNWYIDMYRDGTCTSCAFPLEYSRTIQLAPN